MSIRCPRLRARWVFSSTRVSPSRPWRRASRPSWRACRPGTRRAIRASRRRPSVGWVGRTASQPGGWTPNRFTTIARTVRAFIGPNPGRPRSRASRSLPELASVQTRLASLPYRSAIARVSSWTRAAIAPGKRCRAGGVRKTSTSAVGSIAAIRAASRWPIRRWSSAGPLNAFWTVTCWSSSKPMSRASGSVTSRRSAASSPVKGRRSIVVVMTAW